VKNFTEEGLIQKYSSSSGGGGNNNSSSSNNNNIYYCVQQNALKGSFVTSPLRTIIISYMFQPFLGYNQGDNGYKRQTSLVSVISLTMAQKGLKHIRNYNNM
jgi:hypothetical protein